MGGKITDVIENIFVMFSVPSVHDRSVDRFTLTRICTNAYLPFNLRAS